MNFKFIILSTILNFCALVNSNAQISNNVFVPCQELPNFIQNYKADFNQIFTFYSPHLGNYWTAKNTKDLRGSSSEKLLKLKDCNDKYLLELSKIDFDNLTQECKVDYILIKRDINNTNHEIEKLLSSYSILKSIFPFEDVIYNVGKLRRRGSALSSENIAYQYDSITKLFSKYDSILELNNITLPNLKVAEFKTQDLLITIDWIHNFYNGYDPLYTWWLKEPYVNLKKVLTDYKNKIVAKEKKYQFKDGSNIIGMPIGRDELLQQLDYEMISYTPEEIIAIAEYEFKWCDNEMLKVSKEMGFGNNWKLAVEKVKNSYVPAGKQPELINQLYNQSIDFIRSHDMITLPPLAEETWGMEMMSPAMQKILPFFSGGNEITIAYPTDGMDEDEKLMSMRGNNPHFSRSTVYHELIPGHNLEYFTMARNRTYRDFRTPFWIEGWSFYWEFLMWDHGFPRGPEDRIGMLFWRMTRCARILFSLNYHLGNWTPQQCIDYLVDRVDYERSNAEGEVRRSFEGNYGPLYQIAYMLGALQFNALKTELVDSKKLSLKKFNDDILKLNSMPIEMIRAIMEEKKLSKEYRTNWHFYNLKK